MIVISKAILHIMDFNSGATIYSGAELDMGAPGTYDFLAGHIDKLFKDASAKTGQFLTESIFSQTASNYLDGHITFSDFSAGICKDLDTCLTDAGETDIVDVVVCDFTIETERYLGVMLYGSRPAYTHQVVNDGTAVRNEIIRHYAILPNPVQKVNTFALVNVASGELRFADKKRSIGGEDVYILPQRILQCSTNTSTRETVKLVTEMAGQIAENYGYSSTEAVAKVKSYLAETAETDSKLETAALVKEVFSDSEVLQQELQKGLEEAKLPEQVPVDKNYALRMSKSMKIKTDTGIEIIVPAECLENNDYIEFVSNPDGKISISIKNIGKILNR